MRTILLLIYFVGFGFTSQVLEKEENGFGMELEKKFEVGINEYANILLGWLEGFNNKHLGDSELGRLLHYEDIKPKLSDIGKQGRNMKKLSMALIPLVFHIGATSTWMILTALMAAKSVAIGLALLIFKIAVSSAKVASFFTILKAKHHSPHYEHGWVPHEHYGHKRSLTEIAEHVDHDSWNSYSPEHVPHEVEPPHYKTISPYKSSEPEIGPYSPEYLYKREKAIEKKHS